ncbi:MAG: segregation/condensation protein A, partial [Pseudomonadota bacterium]
ADYEPLHVNRGEIYTMEQALERLQHIIGVFVEWEVLAAYLPPGFRETAAGRRTATASTFAASLELAKRGRVELWQDDYDAPLKMRVKATP